jgi:enamine deaminase RidA (YjgF/YER057c/UK114 family)
MSAIEKKLEALGLAIPAPLVLPPGVTLPFPWVRVHGDRAYVSGHGPQNADGTLASPLGKVGSEVTVEQARGLARLTALAILGSLKRELGDLDRVGAWLRVFGMVNSAPGFRQQPLVINGFSELIVEIYGPERGRHARSAVGMAELPFGIPVEIEAEVAIQQ